ncbi:MAG: LacI family transcriptional regulator [Turicibacter sp.]|nr:LacI family transcriptional regulator [Turicibacter sp.]
MGVTLKDVSKEAGVSIATVSNIINNKEKFVSPHIKEAVNKAIQKLNYKPNYAARSLVSSKSQSVGLIIPDITNPFFAELAKGIEKNLARAGYITFLCNTYENGQLEKKYLDELVARNVDGLIICGLSSRNAEVLRNLEVQNIPYIVLDNRIKQIKKSIEINDYDGGQIAANHLVGRGHKHLAFIGCTGQFDNIKDRHRGYSDVLTNNDIKLSVFQTELTTDGGRLVAADVIDSGATGVFCGNDLIAVGLYEIARQKGIKIPEELSIIGFDDISFAEIMQPKLTTIRQSRRSITLEATTHLIAMMQDAQYTFENVVLPIHLVERESTSWR